MTLVRNDFGAFFAAVHGEGRTPFAWQERLLDHVLETRRWPATIDAPTGSGKTSVIDIHVFALALATAQGGPLPPRRLSMVVGRRVLVDDQHAHATRLRALLGTRDDDALARVAAQLWRLRDLDGDRGRKAMAGESPLVTARLRGGEPATRMWTDEPTAAAVLCATPDMWGSRLLFRGYGSGRRSWPRAAGLLAFDSVVVVDEAHLSRQLLVTTGRVGELAVVAEAKGPGPSTLQVVATTATPSADGDLDRIGVEAHDLDAGTPLTERLTTPKPVTLVGSDEWAKATARHRPPADLARAVVQLVGARPSDRPEAGTVGCFVNTVAHAVAVTHELRALTVSGRRPVVVMLCGQVRPHDVDRLRGTRPGLLDIRGNADVDVIVSTQTLEVGADLDLAGMVTELAAAPALVQRAGRVNRLGRRSTGPITVVVPTVPVKDGQRSGPYDASELRDALAWIESRALDPHGLAPWALRHGPVPAARARRTQYQRPELGDADRWARTSDQPMQGADDLFLWLSEDLEELSDLSLGLVVRERIPDDDGEAVELLTTLPPRRHETFPVPFVTGRGALARAHDDARRSARRRAEEARRSKSEVASAEERAGLRAFVERGGEVHALTWTERRAESGRDDDVWRPDDLRPGDTVIVDAATPLFTAGVDESPQVLVPAVDDAPRHVAADVLEELVGDDEPGPGRIVLRLELTRPDGQGAHDRRAGLDDLRAELRGLPEDADAEARAVVATWLGEHRWSSMAGWAAELLRSPDRRVDVHVLRDVDDDPVRVLIVDRRRATADEDARQEWVPADTADGRGSPKPPTLEDHQRAVADRAALIGAHLGITADLVEALRDAGRLHDEGKRDPRFQVRLGVPPGSVPLAKGDAPSPLAARRRQARAPLPTGWRHEQLSVSEGWAQIIDDVDRDLVARLIGTTHGHGRAGFPHVAVELYPPPGVGDDDVPPAIATELFDEGRWDELIEQTHRRYGLWGCAYLEAVLRAADGQISAEGR